MSGRLPFGLQDAQSGLWRIATATGAKAAHGAPMGLRARLEAAFEQAIELLDMLSGDPDLEATCEDEGGDLYFIAPDDDAFLREITAMHRASQASDRQVDASPCAIEAPLTSDSPSGILHRSARPSPCTPLERL